MNKKYMYIVSFFSILIVAIILRLYVAYSIVEFNELISLRDDAHHYEIANSIYEGKGPVEEYVLDFWFRHKELTHPDAFYPPGFHYILAFFFFLFGNSIVTAKLVSLLFAILTLILIFILGKKIGGVTVGLLSMLFLAVNPVHIFYSVTILREISFLFFSLLSFYFLYLYLLDKKWRYLIFFSLFSALSILINYTMITIFVAAIIILIFKERSKCLRPVALSLLILFIVLLPLGIYTYKYFNIPFYSAINFYKYSNSWVAVGYEKSAPTLSSYLASNSLNDIISVRIHQFGRIIFYLPIYMGPTIFAFYLIGFAYPSIYFIAATFIGIFYFISFIVSLGDKGHFSTRYMLPFIILAIPIAAYSLRNILKIKDKSKILNKIVFVILVLFIMLSSLVTLQQDINITKNEPDMKPRNALKNVAAWIKENTPEEAVIMTDYPQALHFYSNRKTIYNPYVGVLVVEQDIKRIESFKNRSVEETNYYNVSYVLVDEKEGRGITKEMILDGLEGVNLTLVYTDNNILSLYKIDR